MEVLVSGVARFFHRGEAMPATSPGLAAAPSGAGSGPVRSTITHLNNDVSSDRARRVCDGVAAGLWRRIIRQAEQDFPGVTPILRAWLPQSCHDWGMGQMLMLHRLPILSRFRATQPDARPQDPASPARGILLALALSSVAWLGLALVVPRIW
jgi:hypothetical protein